ncbi:MAG: lytic transglycosylase domain-containing protein [Cytophagales bacterium]|nr:lytic transglycosylase domain-containing protein [Rhizobacter sp.]
MFIVSTALQQSSWWLARCAAASLAVCATATLACGPKTAGAALQMQSVAGKFSAAAGMCAGSTDDDAGIPVTTPDVVGDTAPGGSAAAAGTPAPRTNAGRAAPKAAARKERQASDMRPLASVPLDERKAAGVSKESAQRAMALAPQIDKVAGAYRIDPLLLHAIAHVESRHNPQAVSHAGARGLMQVMPQTARRFGVSSPINELLDPRISLEVSAAYLKTLQARFGNNLPIIIAAYNAGEGAVEKYGRSIPPYAETQGYVKSVMAHYRWLLSVRSARGPSDRQPG